MKELFVLLAMLTPLIAVADGHSYDDGIRMCKKLIPDIIRNYGLSSLELVTGGDGAHFADENLLICSYWTPVKEEWGETTTRIATAYLNTTNYKFTVEVR
ncbi:hypothetical protein [Pseudomonas sp. PS01303]|uniref:hypothetical protein n=1 Tax=Pseudomonas sp. PS01303 TaxID=2991439 RepID=UPI00249B789E|nr:hypothetical protein [Pseudomonas sp. PS01303]